MATIDGTSGDDTLNGTSGDDAINGLAGNDTIKGLAGNDTIDGGAGNDTASYEDAPSGVTVSLGAFQGGWSSMEGVAQNTGGAGTDSLTSIENLVGSDFDDVLSGTLTGSVLDGGAGNDTLQGANSRDVLIGGAGWDILRGGYGNDLFIIAAASDHAFAEISDPDGGEVRFTSTDPGETLTLFAGDTGINVITIGTGIATTADLSGTTALNVDASAVSNALYVYGNGGDNSIASTAYADHVYGGAGNDILIGNGGDDWLDGGDGADNLRGGTGNDRLDGGAAVDRMIGGTGDDNYYADDYNDAVVENAGEGFDSVFASTNFVLRANVENLTLTGSANIWGYGNELANALTGNAGTNKLFGLVGNDVIDGGAGADKMFGGTGDDIYYVDNYNDRLIENAGEGIDSVFASTNYVLADQVENLTLQDSANLWAYGNALDNLLTGNSGANKLFGLAGNDTLVGNEGNDKLDGGAGADQMSGGLGDDTYSVDNLADTVTENSGEGTDTVVVSWVADYTLGSNVENLTLSDFAMNGRGNELANTISGNESNNLLFGNAGDDTLYGAGGNDELLGDSDPSIIDNDNMYGGTGDDAYSVNSLGDRVIEYAGEGTDTVYAAVSYTLPQNVENLSVMAANVVGTGNALDNVMNSNNVTGVVLRGMGGNDQLIGYAYDEKLDGGDGNDRIDGSWGNDTIIGGAGDDMLIGGGGRDTLIGGAANDDFVFDDLDFGGATRATADRITDFSQGEDKIDLTQVDASTLLAGDQAFVFVGTAAFSGAAGELRYEQISGNTYVSGDTNGDGTADFMIRLDGLHTLTSSDFGL